MACGRRGIGPGDVPCGHIALIGSISSRNATLLEARWILPRIRSTRRWLRLAAISIRWMLLLCGGLLFSLGLYGSSNSHSTQKILFLIVAGLVLFALGLVAPSGSSDEALPESGDDLLVRRFVGDLVMVEVGAGKGTDMIPTFEGCWPLSFPLGWNDDFPEGGEVDIEAVEYESPGIHGSFDQSLWVVSIQGKRSLQAEASAGALLSRAATPGVWWMTGIVFLGLLVWQPSLPEGVQASQVPGILRSKPPASVASLDEIRQLDPGPGRALRLGPHVLVEAPGGMSGMALAFAGGATFVESLEETVDSIQRRRSSLPGAIERARKEWAMIDSLLSQRIPAREFAWLRKLPEEERRPILEATQRRRLGRIEKVREAVLGTPGADSGMFAGNAAWLRFVRNRAQMVGALASARDSFEILAVMQQSMSWYLAMLGENASGSMASVESLVQNDRWNTALKGFGLGRNSGVSEDSKVWLTGAGGSRLPWSVEEFPGADGSASWVGSGFHPAGRIVAVQSKTRRGWFFTDGHKTASDLFGWLSQWMVVVALIAGWMLIGLARRRRWAWAKDRARQASREWWATRNTADPCEAS